MRKKCKEIWDSLKLIWEFDKVIIFVSVAMAIVDAVLPYGGILLSAHILDELAAGKGLFDLLPVTLGAVGGIFLLSALRSFLEEQQIVHVELCGPAFYAKKAKRTMSMDYQLLDSPMTNAIRTRIENDNNWGSGFYSMIWMLPWLISRVVGLVTAIIILIPLLLDDTLFRDPLALLFLGLFALIILANSIFHTRLNEKFQKFRDSASNAPSFYGYFAWRRPDYGSGKDVRIYGAKPLIQSYCERSFQEAEVGDEAFTRSYTKYQSINGFTAGMASGLLMTLSYLFVVLRAISGAFGVGSVAKYAATIYRFASDLSGTINAFNEYAVAAHRQESTMEYMNIPDVLYKGTLPVEKRDDNQYELAFHNVSFRYPGSEEYVLKNVSLSFKVGERLAVVGMNGSGKTTMIKLLCRLYDPTEGEITLNGIDIKKYRYEEYQKIFSVVFQDFKLLGFPLGQNVAAGMQVDEELAKACLSKAGFGDRLATLPKGLNTPLYKDFDPEGVEISGGEAQKIALARALYKNAPFIILDEPTAALDPMAEYEIYSTFNEIVGDRTAIYISHRLSSCRFCDQILVFDDGCVIEMGGHEELLANNGKYTALWNAQAQYYT